MKDHTTPEHLRVQFVHLHPGNSSRKQRKGSKYMTLAKLWTKQDEPHVIATGIARCSSLDSPSRKTGREVALGRALKAFNEGLEQLPSNFAPKSKMTFEQALEELAKTLDRNYLHELPGPNDIRDNIERLYL